MAPISAVASLSPFINPLTVARGDCLVCSAAPHQPSQQADDLSHNVASILRPTQAPIPFAIRHDNGSAPKSKRINYQGGDELPLAFKRPWQMSQAVIPLDVAFNPNFMTSFYDSVHGFGSSWNAWIEKASAPVGPLGAGFRNPAAGGPIQVTLQ